MSYKITFERNRKRHNRLLDELAMDLRMLETSNVTYSYFRELAPRAEEVIRMLSHKYLRCTPPVVHTTCCVRGQFSEHEPSNFFNPAGHVTSAAIVISPAGTDDSVMSLTLTEEE